MTTFAFFICAFHAQEYALVGSEFLEDGTEEGESGNLL